MIGTTVSHFRILRELGHGGMGVVYVARDLNLERDVALKFLPAQSTGDENATARFVQEARAASALDHENICTIYEIGRTDDGTLFIAMALYGGRTLKEVLEGGALETGRVLDIATQVAGGLEAAHAHGIIHRDIKPANVMLTGREQVKILDFGLAKLTTSTAHLTKEGSTLGTVAYMSPEQLRGADVGESADVWSLGVVLYEMLAGCLPFTGEHPAAVSYAILHEAPKPIATYLAGVPASVTRVLDRALEKDVAKRYPSAAKMLADLRACRGGAATRPRPLHTRTRAIASLVILLVAVAAMVVWQRGKSAKVAWAREVALPEIERLVGERSLSSEQPGLWKAYDLAAQVDRIIPGEPLLERLRPSFTHELRFRSTPAGARVRAMVYGGADGEWRDVGVTPIDILFPLGVSRLEFDLDGYAPAADVVLNNPFIDTVAVTLHRPEEVPSGMVWVPEGMTKLGLPGLEGIDEERVPGFWIDRTEVSNREYKRFVDAGGYRTREYWKHPFIENGNTRSWDEAMARFVDATGRPGPASWEAGDYANGMDDYPVSGVSWYEAAAYAEFTGKQLPTIFHWAEVAFTPATSAIVSFANFLGKGPEPVNRGAAVHRYGALDLAGNVREWCWNESDDGQRFILGGGWNDQPYGFNDAYAQRPFDRSLTNGIRCIQPAGGAAPDDRLGRMIHQPRRDFFAEKPVGDDVFRYILKQYAYDRTDLNARVEYERDEGDWIRQKITFDAAYGSDRVIVYLFLPKGGTPPHQTVVFFPGSGDLYQRSSEKIRTEQLDFFVKSGRAFLYPVYNGMFERGGALSSDQPNEAVAYRDWVVSMAKDLSRSIDYLETREDIDTSRLAFYGVSMGGRLGPLMLAVEPRFKTGVLYVAGLKFQRALPEADPFNFLPRVKLPVLMVSARNDFLFPLETSQRPLFERLGTPAADKKWVVYHGGHSVPRNRLIAETLAWLDHYLGPVSGGTPQ